MKGVRSFISIVITIIIFWFIKFFLKFPEAPIEIIGAVLTIASIIFGLLAGFFISELWSRYTEIRTLQGERSASGLNMIKLAERFYKNKKFKKEFISNVEESSVVDEILEWNEGHLELPYFRKIGDSFKLIKIKKPVEQTYFAKILEQHNKYIDSTTKLDTLGKEKLFPSEWFIMGLLSIIILLSILFLPTTHIFFTIIILALPPVITLTLQFMYNLNNLNWSKEEVSLEPNERIFDAINVKRFYLKKKKSYIKKSVREYRTPEDLKGDLKKVYNEILKKQRQK